jgi:predicted CXXCH cytochrome family protein
MRIAPVLLLLSVMLPISAGAEMVQHFGFSVDGEASMASCVSCHNGKPGKGRDVSRCATDRMCMIYGMHLVEVQYPPTGKEGRYATVEEANIRGFQFDNGRIFCRTCHSLASSKEHLLVMDVQGEKICHGCHLM